MNPAQRPIARPNLPELPQSRALKRVVESLREHDDVRAIQGGIGPRALQLLGAALSSRAAVVAHIEELRREVADVGRELSRELAFAYPEALERTVRRCWEEFVATSPALV